MIFFIKILCYIAGSIYMSHGFSGYQSQQLCDPRLQPFRFLGPTIRSAVALTVLWLAACLLHACLLYFSARSLFRNGQIAVLATILILLTLLTLLSTAALVHIDCKYDPDWPGPEVQAPTASVSVIGPSHLSTDRATKVAWII